MTILKKTGITFGSMEKVNIGLVGCSNISAKHITSIKENPNADIVAVCDVDEAKLTKYMKEIGCRGYRDFNEMLQDRVIDVISICTPSGLHPDMTMGAAHYGKHVITEKPMALNSKDADRMIGVCKEKNTKLFVVKQYRYHPPVIETKRAIDQGRFGKLFLLDATVRWTRPKEYYEQSNWRGTRKLDGGIFLNQAIHHLDILQWLGGNVKRVYSEMGNICHSDIEIEDTGVVTLQFANGALGVIQVTTNTYPRNLEGSITVLGENGSVKIGGTAVNKIDTWEFKDYSNEDEIYRRHLTTPEVSAFGHKEFYKKVISYLSNYKNGVESSNCLEDLVDGFEGKKSLVLAEAIYRSIETCSRIEVKL